MRRLLSLDILELEKLDFVPTLVQLSIHLKLQAFRPDLMKRQFKINRRKKMYGFEVERFAQTWDIESSSPIAKGRTTEIHYIEDISGGIASEPIRAIAKYPLPLDDREEFNEYGFNKEMYKEYGILRYLDCSDRADVLNTPKLYGISTLTDPYDEDDKYYVMFMEYIPSIEWTELLTGLYPRHTIYRALFQLWLQLSYLYDVGVVQHGDLSIWNVLLDYKQLQKDDNSVKVSVIDFGRSRMKTDSGKWNIVVDYYTFLMGLVNEFIWNLDQRKALDLEKVKERYLALDEFIIDKLPEEMEPLNVTYSLMLLVGDYIWGSRELHRFFISERADVILIRFDAFPHDSVSINFIFTYWDQHKMSGKMQMELEKRRRIFSEGDLDSIVNGCEDIVYGFLERFITPT